VRGPETERSHKHREESGFYDRFMRGEGLDIGYKGSIGEQAEAVLPGAIGVDLGYPGYDGTKLPFADESKDYVFASHVLEHIPNHLEALREWFRVIKVGGYVIITVPHQYLYEKKLSFPSNFNRGHVHYFRPHTLLQSIDYSLTPNTWRVRHMIDNDRGYNYSIPPEKHCGGAMEIECVIQKIVKPAWELLP